MATRLLRLNTTVSDGRIIVSFSYPPSAERYKEYLEKPENSYGNKHEWGVALSEAEVSINLPSDITPEFPGGSKDAILAFEDEAKAMKWEQRMILWEKKANLEESKRGISRSLTVGCLNNKMDAFRRNSVQYGLEDVIQPEVSVASVRSSSAQINSPVGSDIFYRLFSGE